MKKTVFMAMAASCLIFASCSKKSDAPKQPVINKTVVIKDSVKIGTQYWASFNYNGDGGVNYQDGVNDVKYGKLYTVTEADALRLPKGWRIPTVADFNKLMVYAGATLKNSDGDYLLSSEQTLKLMSVDGWKLKNGTNVIGFNAYPGGYYNDANTPGQNVLKGEAAAFITSSSLAGHPGVRADFYIYAMMNNGNLLTQAVFSSQVSAPKDRGSLRFVKDN